MSRTTHNRLNPFDSSDYLFGLRVSPQRLIPVLLVGSAFARTSTVFSSELWLVSKCSRRSKCRRAPIVPVGRFGISDNPCGAI